MAKEVINGKHKEVDQSTVTMVSNTIVSNRSSTVDKEVVNHLATASLLVIGIA